MDTSNRRAEILMEALPYIRAFQGKTLVIKYGGAAMEQASLKEQFAKDVLLLRLVGIRPVIVHGGGPQIGALMKRLGKEPRFVGGMRVTDDATMSVVEMVLGGMVNKEIVRLINRAGGRAVGITGKDGKLVRARRVPDLGRVGEVEAVTPEIVERLLSADFIPVIAPIGADEEGETLNINADPFAARMAAALRAEKLVLLTDVDGVRGADGQLLSTLTAEQADRLVASGVIEGGMIPKVACGLDALADGVRKVHIVDGRLEHALLLEIFTDQGIGTELVAA